MLERELKTYDEKRKELLADGGKFVVIAGDKILGIYAEYEEALQVGYAACGLNPFLAKRIEQNEPGPSLHRGNQCLAPQRKMTVPITPLGPVTLIGVGASRARHQALQSINGEIPSRQPASALFDTGSSGTMVDSAIISTLGLSPHDTTQLITPTTGSEAVTLYIYDMSIWLPGDRPEDVLEILTQAIGTNLNRHGVGVLLGRDVLANCIMLYDGAAKTCTLSF